jgi:hypothetical protein
MSSMAQVSDALRQVLTTRAKERERETGFVERSTAQVDGPTFVHTTVFGWLDTPETSYAQLRHVAASPGVPVSSQAVEQRFGAASAALLREAVGEALCSEASAPERLAPLQRRVCTGWHDHQPASGVARRVARLWW